MKFFGETHINFASFRNRAFIISGVLIVAGLVSLAIKGGPDLSIDFMGGTLVQVSFKEAVPVGEVRDVVERAGFEGSHIQNFGGPNDYLITIEKLEEAGRASANLMDALETVAPGLNWRVVEERELAPDASEHFEGGNLVIVEADSLPELGGLESAVKAAGVGIITAAAETETRIAFRLPFLGIEAKAAEQLKAALVAAFPGQEVSFERTETVGPKVGEELQNRTWAAIIISLFGILIYITWRFEFKFAIGAILALIHDVVITLGIFSLLDKEISMVVVAAFLTIVGYSLNDTIVVFDRIRENFGLRRRESYENMINISINESLSRTVITSLTTLIVVLFLFFMGGEVIHDFAFALLIGVVVGTYSSIFVASPVLIEWQNRIAGRLKKQKK
ncbi:MAG: protein translocase subunit SecF [Candidatus Krumholzibacteriota bacterium]|nr:protein translocase subunit SecF [Candidatus Krumholzibacteriota bacterium]